MRKIWVALLVMAPCLFAQGDDKNCKEVSGGVVTNFLSTPAVGASTLGTATGDLRGGLGVVILSMKSGQNGSTVFHVQHHWVTEAGDTIFLQEADLTAFPTPISGLFAARYIDGVNILGGTGRFDRATGNLKVFGAVDLKQDQVILRYQGTICFARPDNETK
jgi:hypothetical protein